MANKKTEIKTEKIEREYVIPLREKCRVVPTYKKANKAVKTIKEFVAKHMKIYDRDLDKIKIDRYLNEFIWVRGIKYPPAKVKVKAIKEGDIVRVELVEMSKNIKFKKAKEEKRELKGKEISEKKKAEKVTEKVEEKPEENKEEKKNEEEKKLSTIEAGKQMEKAAAKQAKHMKGGKSNQPKHQVRMALEK